MVEHVFRCFKEMAPRAGNAIGGWPFRSGCILQIATRCHGRQIGRRRHSPRRHRRHVDADWRQFWFLIQAAFGVDCWFLAEGANELLPFREARTTVAAGAGDGCCHTDKVYARFLSAQQPVAAGGPIAVALVLWKRVCQAFIRLSCAVLQPAVCSREAWQPSAVQRHQALGKSSRQSDTQSQSRHPPPAFRCRLGQ